MEFNAAGEVGGSGGCNTYGGTYTIAKGQLVLSEIVSTLMACTGQAVTEQEIAYLAALQTAGRFAMTSGMLTIWYKDWYEEENRTLTFVQTLPTTPALTPGATLTASLVVP